MAADDVKRTLDRARKQVGITDCIKVRHRPRLLTDNGPCFVSHELADYLKQCQMRHVRSAPYHPMTQGKIERYHRSMKQVVMLDIYFFPWHLEQAIASFVAYYNEQRYHESLDNVTPATVYFGRHQEVLSQRELTEQKTLKARRRYHTAVSNDGEPFSFPAVPATSVEEPGAQSGSRAASAAWPDPGG